jgi:hypothetical protein
MSEKEEPWLPGPDDVPFVFTLLNPLGDRHLAFDFDAAQFYRLWQHRAPEPLDAGEAICLRPSDIDMIIKLVGAWLYGHPTDPRGSALVDGIAAGAKAVVVHLLSARDVTAHTAPASTSPPSPGSVGAAFAQYLDRTGPDAQLGAR